MKDFFQDLPIQTKFSLLVSLVSIGALFLASIAFVALNIHDSIQRYQIEARTLASITSENVKAALDFEDRQFAIDVLDNLAPNQNILFAVLLDQDGEVFAEYRQEKNYNRFRDFPDHRSWVIQQGQLLVKTPVVFDDGHKQGKLILSQSLSPIQWVVLRSLGFAVVILLLGLVLYLRTARYFKRIVTLPLSRLTEASIGIRDKGIYTEVLESGVRDEIGQLTSAFNQMARKIQDDEAKLKEHAFMLEKRVDERTRELKIALEEATAAERAKSEFLAVMSHELRTPLNAIMGFAELLGEETELPQQFLDYVQRIQTAGERQQRLVDNILNYARLDKRLLQPKQERFNLVGFCGDALNELRTQTSNVSIQFENGGSGLEPVPESLMVLSDKTMLEGVLTNLLGNAGKYTREGSITLKIGMSGDDQTTRKFRFEVADTGIGIDTKLLSKLFLPFSQVDSSYKRQFEGAGLGLAISQKLVDLLGGRMGADSDFGKGAVFWFEVPLEIHRLPDFPTPTNKGQLQLDHQVHVLVVEDQHDNALVADAFLKRLDAKSTITYSGAEALDHCGKIAFDLILMDLGMPEMDGFETTDRIRKTENLNQKTPIVALTADATDPGAERCKKAGMVDRIIKPMRMDELFKVLQKQLKTVSR